MKNSRFTIENWRLFFCMMCFAFCVSAVSAQSTRVETPTPITSNELSGRINARDLGDSRLTTYYYIFNGNQGDIYLKIQSANFDGDIDVFYAENMRPLTKITLYADLASEIGREIYLRKPEKLILRVEGRSPNDDAATFSIKFEGSFQALAASGATTDTDTPRVKSETAGAVRVNSVGTILEVPAKPEPEKTVATTTKKPARKTTAPKDDSTSVAEKDDDATPANENLNRKRVADSEDPAEKTNAETPAKKPATTRPRTPTRRPARTTTAKTTTVKAPAEKKPPAERKTPPAPTKSVAEMNTAELAAALENVRLVVLMKNGDKIDRPMSEVLRFSVDKGMLTIISKRGSISRFSILDVEKVSIE